MTSALQGTWTPGVELWWLPDEFDRSLLDRDELARIEAFRHERDARRFAARRAGLRIVLSNYTGVPAAALVIDRRCAVCGHQSHGRPRLRGAGEGLSFSTSSRPGHAVVAVADAKMEVGVDIERVDRGLALHSILWTALGARERASLGPHGDPAAITRIWCRKEAVLKSMGVGLGGPPPLADLDVLGSTCCGWSLTDVSTPEGLVCALSTSAPPTSVRQCEWRGVGPDSDRNDATTAIPLCP